MSIAKMEFYRVDSFDDFEPYYLLKCQKDAVLWSGFNSEPNKEKLLEHFEHNIISNPDIYIYYLKENNDVIGYVQGTKINENIIELSATNIFKKFQGFGYMQDMTRYFMEIVKKMGFSTIIGWLSENNKPAEYNFQYNNFNKLDEFDVRNLPLLGGNHRFYKWVKDL